MNSKVPPEHACTLINATVYRTDGVTVDELAGAFPTPRDPAEVQLWVNDLRAAGLLMVKDTSRKPYRYNCTHAGKAYADKIGAASGVPEVPITPQTAAASPAVMSPAPDASVRWTSAFDSEFLLILNAGPRSAATGYLQNLAMRALPPGELPGFVHYGLNRLDHLTQGECTRHGGTPQQYAAWHLQYFPPAPSSAANGGRPPEATEPNPVQLEPEANGGNPDGTKSQTAAETLVATVIEAVAPALLPQNVLSKTGDASAKNIATAAAKLLTEKKAIKAGEALVRGVNPYVTGGLSPVVRKLLTVLLAVALGWGFYQMLKSPVAAVIVGAFVIAAALGWDWWQTRKGDAEGAVASIPQSLSPSVPGASASRRKALGWLAVVAAACFAGGFALYRYEYTVRRPPKSAVSDYLAKAIAPLPMRIAVLGVPSRVPGTTGCRVTYDARFELTEPLYRKLDPLPYLRAKFPTQLAAMDAATALLNGANGERIRAALGGAQNSLLAEVVLLTTSALPGASAVAKGELLGWRSNGEWAFSGDTIRLDRPPVGERKPDGTAVFVVDAAADLARLTALMTQAADLAAQVQAAAKAVTAELEQNRQQRLALFAQWVRPQTLFMGQVSGVSGAGGSARIAFEITGAQPGSSRLSAVLHNDGGWSDVRPFEGEWSAATNAEECIVTLRTTRDDRVEQGGPLLDDRSDWGVVLHVTADGTATVDTSSQAAVRAPSGTMVRPLRRVDPAQAAAVRAEFSRALVPALGVTKPGLLYRGTVTSRLRQASETLLLLFTAQDTDGSRLEATLASPTNSAWTRPFRGAVIDNSYRAGSTPIRLQTLDADRVPQAPTWSMLAAATGGNGVALNLRVDGGRLVGQDNTFSYLFEPTTEEQERRETGKTGNGRNADGGLPVTPGTLPAAGNSGVGGTARVLPPFPDVKGAYVLSDDGQWTPLPRNNGQVSKKTLVQRLNEMMESLERWEANIAGATPPKPDAVTGYAVFDGGTPVPVVSGDEVVVIYAGALVRDPRVLEKNPLLQFEPVMELGPLWHQDNGMRAAPVISPEKGFYSFGPMRVPATLDQPALGITLLHCKTTLPPRHYALSCGGIYYELTVQ